MTSLIWPRRWRRYPVATAKMSFSSTASGAVRRLSISRSSRLAAVSPSGRGAAVGVAVSVAFSTTRAACTQLCVQAFAGPLAHDVCAAGAKGSRTVPSQVRQGMQSDASQYAMCVQPVPRQQERSTQRLVQHAADDEHGAAQARTFEI